jgi:hypothetical protein
VDIGRLSTRVRSVCDGGAPWPVGASFCVFMSWMCCHCVVSLRLFVRSLVIAAVLHLATAVSWFYSASVLLHVKASCFSHTVRWSSLLVSAQRRFLSFTLLLHHIQSNSDNSASQVRSCSFHVDRFQVAVYVLNMPSATERWAQMSRPGSRTLKFTEPELIVKRTHWSYWIQLYQLVSCVKFMH